MRRFILLSVLCIISCTKYIQTMDCNSSHEEAVITNYGALPDGNTDCGAIINKLIEGFSDNGGTIVIPIGDFAVIQPIFINKDNVTIKGLGSGFRSNIDVEIDDLTGPGGGSKLLVKNGECAVRFASGVKNSRVCDMMISGGEELKGVGVLLSADTESCIISNVVGINLITCVKGYRTSNLLIQDCWFCEVNNSILLNEGTNNTVSKCQLGAKPVGYTCKFMNETGLTIVNNQIYPDGKSCVYMDACNNAEICDNNLKSYYVGALDIKGNANTISGNLIWLANAISGQLIDKSSDYGVLRISGNDNKCIVNTIICDWAVDNPVTVRVLDGERNEFTDCYISDQSSSRVFWVNEHTLLENCVNSDKVLVTYEN